MSITHRRNVNQQGKSERMIFIAADSSEREAFKIILASFFRRIITHLGRDLEAQTISPQDHRRIIKQLRKILSEDTE